MCQTFAFYIIQIFFICLGQTYLYTVCKIQKKTPIYIFTYRFPSLMSYPALGRLGRLPSIHSLLGLIRPMFPPRNSGRLTGNRPNSPKATISQPLPSPQVSHLPPKNGSRDLLFCFSQTNQSLPQYIFNPPSAQHPYVSCISLKATK